MRGGGQTREKEVFEVERTKENETKMSGGRKWKRGGEIKQESGFDFSLLPFGLK